MKKVILSFFILIMTLFAGAQKNLSYFVNQGIQNSPLIKDYQIQIQNNKIDSQRIRAGYGFLVNGNAAGYYAPVIGNWGYDGSITNVHTLNALVGVSRTFIGSKNLANQYLTLNIQSTGLENSVKVSEQDLKRTITQQYINTYGDLLQIDYNQQILTLLKEEEVILKKLAEKGVYKQTDFLSFLVNIQQQELLIRQLKIQYQNDYATLNYFSGLNDTVYTDLDNPVELEQSVFPEPGQTVFYKQFFLDSLNIIASGKQIDYSYRPKFNFFGDGGYNSSFISKPLQNFGLSAGISVSVPIYDGRQRKMLHQKNNLAEQNRQNYRDFFLKQYNQQVNQLRQQLAMVDELMEKSKVQINYAEGLILANRRQLITGDIRIADYIIAISNYLNAKNIIAQTSVSRLQILNQINYYNRK